MLGQGELVDFTVQGRLRRERLRTGKVKGGLRETNVWLLAVAHQRPRVGFVILDVQVK